jgi:hypothetical protein
MDNDPTVVINLSKLVNKKKVNENLNLEAIEREIANNNDIKFQQEINEEEEYNKKVNDQDDEPIREKDNTDAETKNDTSGIDDGTVDDETAGDDEEDDDDEEDESSVAPPVEPPPAPRQYIPPRQYTPPQIAYTPPPQRPYIPPRQPEPVYMQPQPPQNYLVGALQAYSGVEQQKLEEHEKKEEIKERMLSDIGELLTELEQETNPKVDLSRIPTVDSDSRFDVVEKVYRTLKRKYDRTRCESLGKELIVAVAQGLETLFDGQRQYFGYKPDLTGWSDTVRTKMRRMKYETSTIVSNIMEDYNIGPFSRLAIELVPSAFLYSRMRKEQYGKTNYHPGEVNSQYSTAIDDLRQYEDEKTK